MVSCCSRALFSVVCMSGRFTVLSDLSPYLQNREENGSAEKFGYEQALFYTMQVLGHLSARLQMALS